MKKLLLSALALCIAGTIAAQESPLWMRYCTISPDGTTIAFTYKGDIYTVPSTGGQATQITTNPAYDTTPIWSPDGKQIAFASDRMGSMDVFIVSSEGGTPQRLTTYSGSEKPIAFKDATHLLFTTYLMPAAEDAGFPSGQFQQIYEVATTGGRPVMFSSMPMESISINKDGVMLYHDKKDTKTTGVNIMYLLLPGMFGCIPPMQLPPIRNKPLSAVKIVNRFGLPTENLSII